MTVRISWKSASARRLERQFLASSADGGDTAEMSASDVVAAMLGAHAQVLSAAELSVGVRSEGLLEAVGRPSWWDAEVSLRWVLVHMIEETARHAGHMDVVRELMDGVTGDHRPE